jgi:hypothetical protein
VHGPYIPGGFNFFGAIVVDVLAGLVFLIGFVVVVALIVLLVRFLLVATKAAQLYVDRNSAAERVVLPPTETAPAPAESVPPAPTAPAAAADTAPTLPVVTKGPTKPRGPKKN